MLLFATFLAAFSALLLQLHLGLAAQAAAAGTQDATGCSPHHVWRGVEPLRGGQVCGPLQYLFRFPISRFYLSRPRRDCILAVWEWRAVL